jgi:hypothetical protein
MEEWCRWAVAEGLEPSIIAYIRNFPDALHDFQPDDRTSANPRTWHNLSKIIQTNPPKSVESELTCGTVGSGRGIEYLGYLSLYRDIPSIDALLLDPETAPIPEKPDSLYAVSVALAYRANDGNLDRIMQYLDRMPVEFSVLTVKDAYLRNNSIETHPAFVRWCVSHADVVF